MHTVKLKTDLLNNCTGKAADTKNPQCAECQNSRYSGYTDQYVEL